MKMKEAMNLLAKSSELKKPRQMRIAWFSGMPAPLIGHKESGNRIATMADILTKRDDLELFFLYPQKQYSGDTPRPDEHWLPVQHFDTQIYPSAKTIKAFSFLIRELNPDLIHIWGTEWCGPLLATKSNTDIPILVSILGVAQDVHKFILGARNAIETIRWITPHDIFAPSGLLRFWKRLGSAAKMEKAVFQTNEFFECATPYMESWVRLFNRDAKIYSCPPALRAAFMGSCWARKGFSRGTVLVPDAFTTYKAFDVILKAFTLLSSEFPYLRIRVAGPKPRNGYFRVQGYERYIHHLASKRALDGKVEYLGPLDAISFANEMSSAHCVAITSLIESQCIAMLEAMAVGTPIIAPLTGGIPDSCTHMHNGIGYQVGSPIALASALRRLLVNDALAEYLSQNERTYLAQKCVPSELSGQMVRIYTSIIADYKSDLSSCSSY